MSIVPDYPERPIRLDGPRRAPDGSVFPWGVIDQIHAVGEYEIVEFRADRSHAPPSKWPEHGQTYYHPFLNGTDTECYYDTLDEALIGAITYRYDGPDSTAAEFIYRMIGMDA